MNQDPNAADQSRRYHALYRRQRRRLNLFVTLWAIFFAGRALVAWLDPILGLGLGFGLRDVRDSLWMAAGGGLVWLCAAAVQELLFAWMRGRYGPDPGP